MRIGIEANCLLVPHLTGIQYSLLELVRHLPRAAPGHEYRLNFNFTRPEFRQRYEERVLPLLDDRMQARHCRVPSRIMQPLKDWLHWPVEASLGRCDAVFYHSLDVQPQRWGRKVVTIHDLMPMTHADYYPAPDAAHFERKVPGIVRDADALVAVSQYTKDVLVDRLGADASRITVVHHGVDSRFTRPDAGVIAGLKARLGLVRPYLLFVGTAEPRKNLPRLLDAYARLRSAGHADLCFVIAGKAAWGSQALRERISQLKLQDHVVLTGPFDSADLPALYAGADVFSLPSIAEGFGMPLLEAMACGTPVVASNSTALPEVYGDAALGVDPFDSDALCDAIARIRSDGELRESLVERGLQRAAAFSWGKSALRLASVFEGAGT